MKYKLQNGYTIESMKEAIRQGNNGKRSRFLVLNGQPFCAYRGDGGNKCVAGCFIPDDQYTPEMENRGVNSDAFISVKFPLNLQGMRLLQTVHDDYEETIIPIGYPAPAYPNPVSLHETLFDWIDRNVEASNEDSNG